MGEDDNEDIADYRDLTAEAHKAYFDAAEAAFRTWRDVQNECAQLQDWDGEYVTDDEDGLRMWHEWRNMVVSFNLDELVRWCNLAKAIGWDATMELAASV